jgi:hypothetical protein
MPGKAVRNIASQFQQTFSGTAGETTDGTGLLPENVVENILKGLSGDGDQTSDRGSDILGAIAETVPVARRLIARTPEEEEQPEDPPADEQTADSTDLLPENVVESVLGGLSGNGGRTSARTSDILGAIADTVPGTGRFVTRTPVEQRRPEEPAADTTGEVESETPDDAVKEVLELSRGVKRLIDEIGPGIPIFDPDTEKQLRELTRIGPIDF